MASVIPKGPIEGQGRHSREGWGASAMRPAAPGGWSCSLRQGEQQAGVLRFPGGHSQRSVCGDSPAEQREHAWAIELPGGCQQRLRRSVCSVCSEMCLFGSATGFLCTVLWWPGTAGHRDE